MGFNQNNSISLLDIQFYLLLLIQKLKIMKKLPYFLMLLVLFCACGPKQDVELAVMTFNIRMDTPYDSLNSWQYRKDVATEIIVNQNIDIVGTQEVLYNQLSDLNNQLKDYDYIGVGREDGKNKGEFSSIFYNKKRLTLVDSGTYWLSETPDVPGSKGWNAACERVATWGIFNIVNTNQQVFAINTHLDHVSNDARVNGIKLILKQIKKLDKKTPIVLTGDFNSTPDSEVVTYIKNHLIDTREIAKETYGPNSTFHNFGKIPENDRNIIDYIFVNEGVEVTKYSVLDEKLDGIFLSDHNPVVANIVLK